jgi:phospholipid N-methyltransferase
LAKISWNDIDTNPTESKPSSKLISWDDVPVDIPEEEQSRSSGVTVTWEDPSLGEQIADIGKQVVNLPGSIGRGLTSGAENLGASLVNIDKYGKQGLANVIPDVGPLGTIKRAFQEGAEIDVKARDFLENRASLQDEAMKDSGNIEQYIYNAAKPIPQIGASVLTGPAAPVTMGLTAASQYAREAELDGASVPQQLAYGAIMGTIEGLTEKIPLDAMMKVLGGKSGVKAWIKSMGMEAIQEAITDPLQMLTKKGVYSVDYEKGMLPEFDKDMPDIPWTGENGVINPGRALQSGLQGAVTAGLIGGPGVIMNRLSGRTNTTEEEPNAQIQEQVQPEVNQNTDRRTDNVTRELMNQSPEPITEQNRGEWVQRLETARNIIEKQRQEETGRINQDEELYNRYKQETDKYKVDPDATETILPTDKETMRRYEEEHRSGADVSREEYLKIHEKDPQAALKHRVEIMTAVENGEHVYDGWQKDYPRLAEIYADKAKFASSPNNGIDGTIKVESPIEYFNQVGFSPEDVAEVKNDFYDYLEENIEDSQKLSIIHSNYKIMSRLVDVSAKPNIMQKVRPSKAELLEAAAQRTEDLDYGQTITFPRESAISGESVGQNVEGLPGRDSRRGTKPTTTQREGSRIQEKTRLEEGRTVSEGKDIQRQNKPATGQRGDSGDGSKEPTFKHVSEFSKRIKSGDVTAQEVRDHYQYMLDNEQPIKDSILEYLNSRDEYKRKRNDTKKKLVDDTYERELERLAYAGDDILSYEMSPNVDGRTKAIKRNLDALTDEKIKSKAAKEKQSKEAHIKSLTNPETLSEFRDFVYYKGEDKLTPEQRARYDELRSEGIKEKKQTELEKKGMVSKVNTEVGMTLKETVHTRDKYPLFVVQMEARVDGDTFKELNTKAKQLGGYYSSFRGSGAVPGFQFKEKANAEKFMSLKEGDVSRTDQLIEKREQSKNNAAQRLKDMADSLEEKANEELNRDRQVNTARRARMASSAESSAQSNIAFAKTMRHLAEAIESGEAKHLDGIRASTHIEELNRTLQFARNNRISADKDFNNRSYDEREEIRRKPFELADVEHVEYPFPEIHGDHIKSIVEKLKSKYPGYAAKLNNMLTRAKDRGGYRLVKFETESEMEFLRKTIGKLKQLKVDEWDYRQLTEDLQHYDRVQTMGLETLPQLRAALREYLQYRGKKAEVDPIKAMERDLAGKKIEGYFPTPKPVVNKMMEAADIEPGMKVLEPSAGKGNIADTIRDEFPENDLSVVEVDSTLRSILEKKGHNVTGHDFLVHKGEYDRIVMNPPFENGQDIDHVKHAYDLLKPGGRVVSIMSEGPFFRSDKKATEFREWLDEVGGESEKLPDKSFAGKDSERTTGVSTRMVVIDKPGKSSAKVTRGEVESIVRKAGFENIDEAKAAFDEMESGDKVRLGLVKKINKLNAEERNILKTNLQFFAEKDPTKLELLKEKLDKKYKVKINRIKYQEMYRRLLIKQEGKQQLKERISSLKDRQKTKEQRHQEAKEKLRERISNIRERQKEKEQLRREQREETAEEKAERQAKNKLIQKIKDVDIKHMRPEFQRPVKAILEDINLVSPSKKTGNKLQRIAQYLQSNPENNIPQSTLNALKRLDRKNIRDMTLGEIQTVHDAVYHYVHLNKLKNKLIFGRIYKDAATVDNSAADNIINYRKSQNDPAVLKGEGAPSASVGRKYFMLSKNMETIAEELDANPNGVIKTVAYDGINEGVSNQIKFRREVHTEVGNSFKEKGITTKDILPWSEAFNVKKKDVQYTTYKLKNGQELTLSTAERIDLYLHSKSNDNMKHILGGGLFKANDQYTRYKITQKDVDTILADMSEKEVQVAEAFSKTYNGLIKDRINETSVELNGFEMATEPNYNPIKSNRLEIKRDPLKPRNPGFNQFTIEGMGILKERTGGKNGILIEDAFTKFFAHTEKTSAYVGLAKPLRNLKMLVAGKRMKWELGKLDAGYTAKRFDNYIRDIEGSMTDIEDADKLTFDLIHKIDTAILGVNPWVIMKQPISYLLEANEISPKYLTKAVFSKKDLGEVIKWSPQLAERIEGDVTVELGELGKVGAVRHFFTGISPLSSKLTEGIVWADNQTVGRTWNAVKAEVSEKHPELKGDDYYREVARRTEEIYRKTQSAFQPKDRSELGRSKSVWIRMMTRFTSQRNICFNALIRARTQYNYSQKTVKDKSAYMGKLFNIVVISSLAVGLVDRLRDLLYDREQDDPVESGVKMIADALSYFYGAGDAFSAIVDKTQRGTFAGRDWSSPFMQTANNLFDTVANANRTIGQVLTQERYKSGPNSGDLKFKKTAAKAFDGALAFVSKIKGLPYENVQRLVSGTYRKATADPQDRQLAEVKEKYKALKEKHDQWLEKRKQNPKLIFKEKDEYFKYLRLKSLMTRREKLEQKKDKKYEVVLVRLNKQIEKLNGQEVAQ